MQIFKPKYSDRKTKEARPSSTYHIRFTDHMSRRQRVTGYSNYNETHSLWIKLSALITCRRTGEPIPANISRWLETISNEMRVKLVAMNLLDDRTAYADVPLIVHLEGKTDEKSGAFEPGYKQELIASGASDKHVSVTIDRCKRVIVTCGFNYWRDLTQPGATTKIRALLSDMRINGREDAKAGRGNGKISGRTFNYYCRDIRSFCRRLDKTGRAPGVALENLEGVNDADADSVAYRPILKAEMPLLLAAASAAPVRHGLTGDERAVLYRFAYESALRPNQIRALTVSSFNLDKKPATVSSRGRYVKRRREHEQQLTASLAAVLGERFKSMVPTVKAFRMPSAYHLSDMLRDDLADARTAWIDETQDDDQAREIRQRSFFLAVENEKGEKAVFYSLRHGHGTALADAGVPEKNIGASMHHGPGSNSTKRYMHTDSDSVASAIAMIPDLTPMPLAATGTDAQATERLRAACATGRSSMQFGAVGAKTHGRVKVTTTLAKRDITDDSTDVQGSGPLAELADAVDSKSTAFTGVSVRVR